MSRIVERSTDTRLVGHRLQLKPMTLTSIYDAHPLSGHARLEHVSIIAKTLQTHKSQNVAVLACSGGWVLPTGDLPQ
jgi:hypothetical protein